MRPCCGEGKIYLVTFVRRKQGNDCNRGGNVIYIYIYIYNFTPSKTPMKLICSVYILGLLSLYNFFSDSCETTCVYFFVLVRGEKL